MLRNEMLEKGRVVSGYFLVLLLFWLLSIYWWATMGYEGTFLWLNQYRFAWVDSASLYFLTHLADGLILPGILLLVLWRKDPALALTAVIAVFATGILAQFGKLVLFTEWYRPPMVFADHPDVTIVAPHPPGRRSFPSGHATSFATGGFFLAYYLGKWKSWMTLVVGVLTVALCFTRVVLGVHFPGDIFVGSMLGSLGSFLLLVYLYPLFQTRLGRRDPDRLRRLTPVVLGVALVAMLGQYLYLISKI